MLSTEKYVNRDRSEWFTVEEVGVEPELTKARDKHFFEILTSELKLSRAFNSPVKTHDEIVKGLDAAKEAGHPVFVIRSYFAETMIDPWDKHVVIKDNILGFIVAHTARWEHDAMGNLPYDTVLATVRSLEPLVYLHSGVGGVWNVSIHSKKGDYRLCRFMSKQLAIMTAMSECPGVCFKEGDIALFGLPKPLWREELSPAFAA